MAKALKGRTQKRLTGSAKEAIPLLGEIQKQLRGRVSGARAMPGGPRQLPGGAQGNLLALLADVLSSPGTKTVASEVVNPRVFINEGIQRAALGAGPPLVGGPRIGAGRAAAADVGAAAGGLPKGVGTGLGIGALLTLLIKDALLETSGAGVEADLQGAALDAQSAAATPENFLIQALLPSSEQQKQQAMQALLNQLTGGNAPPILARGEILT